MPVRCNDQPIGIIVLAAGSSSRMGQSKQLLKVDGEYLLLKSVNTALQTQADKVVVVLGANYEEHRNILTNVNVELVQNETWSKGMGSSIKAGLNHLLSLLPDIDAVIIMVCDQPLLTTQHLLELISTFQNTTCTIVASRYANTNGVPALFDKSLFGNLLALDDKHGAKIIMERFNDSVHAIDFPEGVIDIDTQQDYDDYRKRSGLK